MAVLKGRAAAAPFKAWGRDVLRQRWQTDLLLRFPHPGRCQLCHSALPVLSNEQRVLVGQGNGARQCILRLPDLVWYEAV